MNKYMIKVDEVFSEKERREMSFVLSVFILSVSNYNTGRVSLLMHLIRIFSA